MSDEPSDVENQYEEAMSDMEAADPPAVWPPAIRAMVAALEQAGSKHYPAVPDELLPIMALL